MIIFAKTIHSVYIRPEEEILTPLPCCPKCHVNIVLQVIAAGSVNPLKLFHKGIDDHRKVHKELK
jgi:hypothetical protein